MGAQPRVDVFKTVYRFGKFFLIEACGTAKTLRVQNPHHNTQNKTNLSPKNQNHKQTKKLDNKKRANFVQKEFRSVTKKWNWASHANQRFSVWVPRPTIPVFVYQQQN